MLKLVRTLDTNIDGTGSLTDRLVIEHHGITSKIIVPKEVADKLVDNHFYQLTLKKIEDTNINRSHTAYIFNK